jgi:hypothetical protein
MAKRYSGSLKINVVYDDKGHYRTSVSSGGKSLWRGTVNPAPADFGPSVEYNSAQAYDEIASSAIAFADDEKGGIADEAEYDENLTRVLIRRTPRSKARHHSTKKTSPAQLERDVHKALILSLKPGAKVITNGYPGSIVRITPYKMVEVRLPGGVVCVSAEDVQIR